MASIRKISETSYKVTVSCGRDAGNKQIRHYMTWTPDKPMTEKQMEKAVQKAAYEFEKQIELGFRPDDSRTFQEFAEYFIELKKAQGVSARTLRIYDWVKMRIYAAIGSMRIVDIRPHHINKFYAQLAKPGAKLELNYCYPKVEIRPLIEKRGKQSEFIKESGIYHQLVKAACNGQRLTEASGRRIAAALGEDFSALFRLEKGEHSLSNETIEKHHVFVQMVLDEAEKDMLITYNPARRATVPKVKEEEKKPKCLQPEELKAVISALDDECIRSKAIISTFMYTGMRRGELCALKWEKIDFEKRQILIDAGASYTKATGVICGPTKTGNTRYVPMAESLVSVLKAYRKWYIEERFRLCGYWQDNDYVFPRNNGEILPPQFVNVLMNKFCKAHSIPHITSHQFRHTAASLMIANGTDVVTAAGILGHKNTSMTLDVYSHAIDTAKEKAANTMEAAIEACKIG